MVSIQAADKTRFGYLLLPVVFLAVACTYIDRAYMVRGLSARSASRSYPHRQHIRASRVRSRSRPPLAAALRGDILPAGTMRNRAPPKREPAHRQNMVAAVARSARM